MMGSYRRVLSGLCAALIFQWDYYGCPGSRESGYFDHVLGEGNGRLEWGHGSGEGRSGKICIML